MSWHYATGTRALLPFLLIFFSILLWYHQTVPEIYLNCILSLTELVCLNHFQRIVCEGDMASKEKMDRASEEHLRLAAIIKETNRSLREQVGPGGKRNLRKIIVVWFFDSTSKF